MTWIQYHNIVKGERSTLLTQSLSLIEWVPVYLSSIKFDPEFVPDRERSGNEKIDG